MIKAETLQNEYIRDTESKITSLEKLLDVSITIIDFNGRFHSSSGHLYFSPERQSHRRNFVCEKSFCRKCPQHCRYEVGDMALRNKVSFLHNCWRGVAEIVIPLYMDNVFAGQMFAGQWRAGSSEADKQKEAGKVLAKLSPLPEKNRIDDLSRVLTCFADGLMLSLGESKVKYASTREEQIRLFIERNYHKQISLSDLAAEMCVSESRASHLVNQYCNTSFQEALIQRRLAAAKSFLLSVEMRISEIAFAVGFNDPYYFSRIFKKKIGMSPKDFRAFSAKSK